MKAILRLLPSLVVALLIAGCVPVDSLNPIYTEKNVIFDSALLGEWAGDNPDEGVLRIERAGDNAYQLLITERTDGSWMRESVYDAHLVSLGGEQYLDLQPRQLQASDAAKLNVVFLKSGLRLQPSLLDIGGGLFLEFGAGAKKDKAQEIEIKLRSAHWIMKVEQDHGILRLAYLDDEWLKNEIKRGSLVVAHTRAKGESADKWVLTGSTAELQQFVVGQADREGAFSGGITLKKQKDAAPQHRDPES